MRSKALCAVFSLLFAGSLFLGPDVYARRWSGSGSSRSSSSGGSSWGSKTTTPPIRGYGNTGTRSETTKSPTREGYGNTATKPSGAASTPSGSSAPPRGYGNTATSSQTKGGQAGSERSKSTPLQNRMNRSFSKQESARAYENYKAQQGRFKMSSKPGDYRPSARETATIDSVQSRVRYSSSSDYYARRTVFYGTYGWSPPGYVYRSYNRFGIWDAMMLWFMLDHIYDAQYAAMYYDHRDDPGMKQFRKEIERLSAENAELKAKVAKLDESAKLLEQQGVKPDPSYMPQDAASIALAAGFADKGVPKSSGFPWMWVIGIGAFALIGFIFLRRRR
jgi:hypothetical protein